MTQSQRVYRLLLYSLQLRTVDQIARVLAMPVPSVRRCISELRALGIGIETRDGFYTLKGDR